MANKLGLKATKYLVNYFFLPNMLSCHMQLLMARECLRLEDILQPSGP